ncbi:Protein CBG09922 [Caenorhabditis briggsae]|uniref:Protein CBG09922 n=1 Tax=Caenorhabditis briggsae TaxID=6238 RepID=A8X9Z0_CAEBR|nr:Protein CBG09922 [Caenorhabditis briggsae]CAP29455.2 Protein CBG09922 [Caenorhabditis briggsae]
MSTNDNMSFIKRVQSLHILPPESMGQYLVKNRGNSPDLANLPDTVHREIFKYLKPWDLFKLSRVSTDLKNLINGNTSFTVKFHHICLDENAISMRLETSDRYLINWTFCDASRKPYWTKRFLNKCHYGKEFHIDGYYENVAQSFLFVFQNIVSIFKTDANFKVGQLLMHPSRLDLLSRLPNDFLKNMSCEKLSIKSTKANQETDRKNSMDFAKQVLSTFHLFKYLEISFSSLDGNFEYEKQFESLDSSELDDYFIENRFDDIYLNFFLKNWMFTETKSIISCRIIEKRIFNLEVILDGLDTTRWDGRNWSEIRNFYKAGAEHSFNMTREDKSYAVISISIRIGNGWNEFGILCFYSDKK